MAQTPMNIIGSRESWPLQKRGPLVKVQVIERVFVRMTEEEAREQGLTPVSAEKAKPGARNKARRASSNKAEAEE
jgi:hypothetical protein